MKGGVYKLYWKECSVYYIGSSKDLSGRKSQHSYDLRVCRHHNPTVQSTYQEYGLPEFEILTLCEGCTKEELYEHEKFYLDQAIGDPNCANLDLDPYGKGRIVSEETRIKLGEVAKGRVTSEETKRKLSEMFKGRTFSEETIQRMRIANRGERNPMYGRTLGKNSMAKKVINTETLEVYSSAKEVIILGLVNMQYPAFKAVLRGKTKTNLTPYEYLNNYEAVKNGTREPIDRKDLNRHKVINTETGQIFNSVREVVAKGLVPFKDSAFYRSLKGLRENPTPFMYLEDYEKQTQKIEL